MRALAAAPLANWPFLRQRTRSGVGWFQKWRLAAKAEAEFDLFITSDQNIRYQQNLAGRLISILELSTNDLRHILAAGTLIEDAIERIKPAEFRHLDIP